MNAMILSLEFSLLDKVKITLQNKFEFVRLIEQIKVIQKVVLVTLLVTLAHAKTGSKRFELI